MMDSTESNKNTNKPKDLSIRALSKEKKEAIMKKYERKVTNKEFVEMLNEWEKEHYGW